MSHTSGNILLHFIFSTAGRRPLITAEFRDDLFAYLGGIIREMNGSALIVNGVDDHVHMLIRVRPVHSAADIARVVKAFLAKNARMAARHAQILRRAKDALLRMTTIRFGE